MYATLFHQNTHKAESNAVKMSQAFHDITQFERFTDICLEGHSKLGNGCFTILFEGAYFLLAVMVEGYESSQLRMAN